jgi:hypothetical protein
MAWTGTALPYFFTFTSYIIEKEVVGGGAVG